MLISDLYDFSDAYIVVNGRATASFNPRKNDYNNNDFLDALFPNNIFPDGRTADQITNARNAAKNTAVNAAKMLLMMQETLLKTFLLETMLHLSNVFQKLMGF